MMRHIFYCLILFLTGTVAAQEAQLPSSAAGQRLAAYLKAYNSNDDTQMREFFTNHVAPAALERRPAEARLQVFREMRGEFGNFELRRVTQASDSSVTIIVRTAKAGWLEIGFECEPQPPHKLLGLRVEDTDPPNDKQPQPALSTGPLTEKEALAETEKYLEEQFKADNFSGVVLLAKNGQPVFQKAYGLASKEFGAANRLDTKFNLGSINKLFTQLAIGQLVEQGKLSYEDKLGKHLPDYPNRDAAAKVTVRHLLGMSSGISDFFGPKYEATPKDTLRSVKDFLPLFAAEPLLFEPGSQQRYSNGGYIVLGAIIEKASGRDYYEYIRENIFKPAGMSDTEWYEADAPTPNLATGYIRDSADKPRRNNIYTRPAKGSPAGGGYSTAPDLLKFAIALQTGKLRAYDFRNPQASGPFGGLGFAGGAPGLNGVVEIGPADGYTIIVLCNYDPPIAEKASRQVRGWLNRVKK